MSLIRTFTKNLKPLSQPHPGLLANPLEHIGLTGAVDRGKWGEVDAGQLTFAVQLVQLSINLRTTELVRLGKNQ